eukprot:SM000190S04877  [mRNA]  locus=s190:91458:96079:- [translate_table: standard]
MPAAVEVRPGGEAEGAKAAAAGMVAAKGGSQAKSKPLPVKPGRPDIDLASQLQQAWLRTQLPGASGSPKAASPSSAESMVGKEQPTPHKNLKGELERLFARTQSSIARANLVTEASSASSSAGATIAESDVGDGVKAKASSEEQDLSSFFSTFYAERLENGEGVNADIAGEDFFRGLDGLHDAFYELEHLLPSEEDAPEVFDVVDLDRLNDSRGTSVGAVQVQQQPLDGTSIFPIPTPHPELFNPNRRKKRHREVQAAQEVGRSASGVVKHREISGVVSNIHDTHGSSPEATVAVSSSNPVRAKEEAGELEEEEDINPIELLVDVAKAIVANDKAKALGARPGGPPSLRITGIDLPIVGERRAYCIVQAGERLKEVAAKWGVPFEYEKVPSKLEAVSSCMLNLREGDAVAVNCALRLHQVTQSEFSRSDRKALIQQNGGLLPVNATGQLLDESVTPSNPRNAVLRTIHGLKPKVVTLVEQNTNHNSPFFLARFYEALFYYAGLFDSIDASIPRDVTARRVFEQQVLGRAIVNVVAAEGQDRVERQESLGQWQRRLVSAGFIGRSLVPSVIHTVNTYRKGYGLLEQDESSLILTWQDRPLIAMSAWQPASSQKSSLTS